MTTVNVRYMVNDVEAAVAFYTTRLGFTLISKTLPAFADVARGDLRLLLSGPASSAGRPMPDGRPVRQPDRALSTSAAVKVEPRNGTGCVVTYRNRVGREWRNWQTRWT